LGGILLALNPFVISQTISFNSAVQKALSPVVEIAESKEPEPVQTPAKPAPKRVVYVVVTAYSSTPDQTDDTPFITANGTHVRDGIIAANFLKFGTRVKFPDFSGDKIFSVQDRMNARYSDRVDIWMESREAAMNFGVRTLKMEIY
jgi:3D (Asp-Asp-Asp) domain-containing protein